MKLLIIAAINDSTLDKTGNTRKTDVNKLKVRLRKGSEITRTAIEKLKNSVNIILGEKSDTCLKLINKFSNKDIQSLDFIESLRLEIGRYSGLIMCL